MELPLYLRLANLQNTFIVPIDPLALTRLVDCSPCLDLSTAQRAAYSGGNSSPVRAGKTRRRCMTLLYTKPLLIMARLEKIMYVVEVRAWHRAQV